MLFICNLIISVLAAWTVACCVYDWCTALPGHLFRRMTVWKIREGKQAEALAYLAVPPHGRGIPAHSPSVLLAECADESLAALCTQEGNIDNIEVYVPAEKQRNGE